MTNKHYVFFFSLIGVLILITLISPELMAVKDDQMKGSAEFIDKFIRGNFARIVVACGCLWGVIRGFMQSNLLYAGGGIVFGIIYFAANLWIDSALAALI